LQLKLLGPTLLIGQAEAPVQHPSPLRLRDFLPYRLSLAANLTSEVIASAYQALFGLRIPEWRVIAVLAEEGGLTQQGVGGATRMDKVAVSRATAALVERRLVVRRDHPGDRRSQQLFLTEAGRRLYAEVAPKALELEGELAGALAPAEREQFLRTLDRLERRAVDLLGASRLPVGA
jgi:DNA-binding MarR family transcriptional regulator